MSNHLDHPKAADQILLRNPAVVIVLLGLNK
jgi:hypothetical protein